jgi:hypothetical protein
MVYTLRKRRYTLKYLARGIQKDTVNPVMAVETRRLTKDEHEQLLRRENTRKRLSCIELAKRIALDYCEKKWVVTRHAKPDFPFLAYQKPELSGPESRQTLKTTIMAALVSVTKDEDVGQQAQEALSWIEEKCPELLN